MVDSLEELKANYDEFLRHERFNQVDRIITAIDDVTARRANNSSSKFNNKSKNTASRTSNADLIPRISINLNELQSLSPTLEHKLHQDPFRHLRALEIAAHEIATEERPGYDKNPTDTTTTSSNNSTSTQYRMRVAIQGPIKSSKPSSPRTLLSSSLSHLVCIEGVAIKLSAVKPKLVQSVHYCPTTSSHTTRDYADATDVTLNLPKLDTDGNEIPDQIIGITTSTIPTKDKDQNLLEMEFGLSTYRDTQTVTLQEMPERAPMGQLPRSVDCLLQDDLVDRMKPGDRVRIVGVYRALGNGGGVNGQSSTSGVFRTVVLVNHVLLLGRDSMSLNYMAEDVKAIRSLANPNTTTPSIHHPILHNNNHTQHGQKHKILDILGRSMAPSIHGHTIIKKALILQLLSGCEKNLDNGTHLRGDVNILMVGDPSTAKSQLLRSVMSIAPLAISTTGKGSTGVGLTAAVTSDSETNEKRLEAGAMVLGDRGIVCVDEFDKMSEGDRVAIHEAMEQQTVTIAKAGIHATLNARCSILAAANPVYGQYDRRRRIQENIGLPDSLLSRFDLLFVVLDTVDPDVDRKIAGHVIQGHRFRTSNKFSSIGGSGGGCGFADSDDEDDYSDEEDDSDEDDIYGGGDDEDGQRNSGGISSRRANNPYHSVWKKSRYSTDLSQQQEHNTLDDSDDDDDHHQEEEEEDPSSTQDILQHEFLRKYLHFAKTRIQPILTEDAREYIVSRYAEMRSRQDERTLPVTARTLETVIRLASAHAKARLSMVVEADPDCMEAMDILSFALYHDHEDGGNGGGGGNKKGNVKHTLDNDGSNSTEGEGESGRNNNDDDDDNGGKSAKRMRRNEEPSTTNGEENIGKRIWEDLRAGGDGKGLDEFCVDVTDRDLVRTAAQELEASNRIMISDDVLYLV